MITVSRQRDHRFVADVVSTRKVLLCATFVLLCASFTPASEREPITTPILATCKNFRDLAGIAKQYGGTGFVNTTSHDGAMRTKVFYRSNQLYNLSDADLATLSSLNIELIVDLRTPSEYLQWPDTVPAGATWINVNIYGTDAPPPAPTKEAEYCRFVIDPGQRAALGAVLLDMARASGPVLFHCKSGKDRTGWSAMILQSIAGVSPATIMQDYMASNAYLDRPDAVCEHWLQAGLDQATLSFGSMDAYLKEGLGLTQADIYVLRAKMVYYPTLPGQDGFVGNAAAGADLLNSLQDSPLSGRYTAFNYYLQSAIDAGTLGGVETQVGGQVYADSVSYLSRQPLWVDWAIAPYVNGRNLCVDRRRIWAAGLGNYLASDARPGIAGSAEQNAGTLVGITRRLADRTSGFLGIGYNSGAVGSAGGNVAVNTILTTFGGCCGLCGLDAGPYVAARGDFGWAEYRGIRALGGGMGIARGDTSGGVYSARVDLGNVIRLAPLTIAPQIGGRVTNANLGSFRESGSELALAVHGITHTIPSFLADLDIALDRRQWHGWLVTPSADIGYEVALGNPEVAGTAELYGYAVNQQSAYNSWHVMKVGLAATAERGSLAIGGGVDALFYNGASTGIIPQLSICYSF